MHIDYSGLYFCVSRLLLCGFICCHFRVIQRASRATTCGIIVIHTLHSCQYSSRIMIDTWAYYLSEIFLRPSLVKPLTLVLSFSIFSSILSFFFCSSCASNDSNPNSSAFCTLLFNIASFVFSAILSLVSSECFFPTFHGTFPLFAADIFALLESE
jgi:hypothetical protein